jgi:tight adherence protein B
MTALLLAWVFIAAFSGVCLWVLTTKDKFLSEPGDTEGPSRLLRHESISTIRFWARMLGALDLTARVRTRLAEAQLTWSAGRLSAMMLLAGAVACVLLSSLAFLPGLIVLLASCVAAWMPYQYVLSARARRFRRLEDEFPDALDMLCRALKAGHPFAAALELVASEGPPAIASEARHICEQWKLGSSWDAALDSFADRVPLPEVSQLTGAVKLHRRAGGRLGDVLATLADTMREAAAIRGEVRAISAHGRLTATVLTVIPFVIAAAMYAVSSSYLSVLLEHPYGKHLIVAAIASLALGHFVMRRIVDVRV